MPPVSSSPTAAFPLWPLVASLAMQTLATMAAFSLPAAAPEVARDLGVDDRLIGFFVSLVYGVGILSALLSPGYITSYGAVRVGQFVLLGVVGMLATASSGLLWAVALSAVILGSGYGATAPVSAHLLMPRTPPGRLNLVLSIRQIGVPLGGVLSGLLVPPLVLLWGWQSALLVQLLPALALLILLQPVRRSWDVDRSGARPSLRGGMRGLVVLLRDDAALRSLALACFAYAGIQLCFIAYMAVHLTSAVGVSLVLAGQALAAYQVAGVVSRPIWGWIADRIMPARHLLALHGAIMAGAAVAAGQFASDWPFWLVLLTCITAGATASGFTGIAYGEFARQGGARGTEATAIGSGAMFAGVMLLPSGFGVVVSLLDDYAMAYAGLALIALLGAALLLTSRKPA